MSGSSKRKRKFSSDDDDALRELVSSILSGRYKEETYLWDVSSVCRARPESAPRLLALIDRYRRIGRMPAPQYHKVKARIEQVLAQIKPAAANQPVSGLTAVAEEDIDGIDIDVELPEDSDPADDYPEDSPTREVPARAVMPRRPMRGVAMPAPMPAAIAPAPPAPVAPATPAVAPPPVVAPMAAMDATRLLSDETRLITPLAAPLIAAPPSRVAVAAPARAPTHVAAATPSADTGAAAPIDASVVTAIGVSTVLHDRYELGQLLGRGGIATVYKAVDRYRVNLGLEDCYVAVKIVQPHPSRPGSVAALGREFHNAQLLSHPNVINVFNIDHAGDASFYTMELLDGERLSQLMKRIGVLPRPYALAVIRDIGAAIAHAHSRGVVHADLKPHNIMITRAGQVRVLDFGSGTIRAREPWISEMSADDNYRQATPAYASCEQLEGWSADPRDDIYALACLAYQQFAGRHPFDMQPSLDARAQKRQPRRPPGLRGEQWRALKRGLAWTREQRTMAVEDWLKDLGVAAAAPALPPLSLLHTGKLRNVWLQRAAAAALLVAGLGLAAFALDRQTAVDWRSSLTQARSTLQAAWTGLQQFADSTGGTADAATVTPATAPDPAPVAPSPSLTHKASSVSARTLAASATHSSRAASAQPDPVGDDAGHSPDTHAMAQPLATAAPVVASTDIGEPGGAAGAAPLQFSAASYIVPGSEPAARIVVRRTGSTDGDLEFVWWTEEGSAKADVDYASLGRRVERIPSGSDRITVYVPIISNAQRHDLTQFYVELGTPGSFRSTGPGTRSLVTIDHGS